MSFHVLLDSVSETEKSWCGWYSMVRPLCEMEMLYMSGSLQHFTKHSIGVLQAMHCSVAWWEISGFGLISAFPNLIPYLCYCSMMNIHMNFISHWSMQEANKTMCLRTTTKKEREKIIWLGMQCPIWSPNYTWLPAVPEKLVQGLKNHLNKREIYF